MKSIIRIAQIRAVSEKGKLDVNHKKLISVLKQLRKHKSPLLAYTSAAPLT